MKFSIIIPVYNASKYLESTIESIVSQDFTDYEIILVDDGSSDDSWKLCKQFSQKFKNIRCFTKENGGASSARNYGIDKAIGEYIVFVDSDDKLVSNSLAKVNDEIEDEDAIVVNYITSSNNDGIYKVEVDTKEFMKFNGSGNLFTDVLDEYMAEGYQVPWNPYQTIFKTTFVKEHNILFNTEYTVAEDADYFLELSQYVNKFKITDVPLVIYNVDSEGSLIKTQSYINLISQLKVFKKFFDLASNKNNLVAKRYFANRFANVVILVGYVKERTYRKKLIDYINSNIGILKWTTDKFKYRLLHIFLNLVGLPMTIMILNYQRRAIRILRKKYKLFATQ